MQSWLLTLSLPAFTLAPLSAQTIWTVDASGGAGSQFTDIPTAVATASAGDTVIVRPGNYIGFTVDKPIHVLGQPGATITAPGPIEAIQIENIPANTDCTVAGLTVDSLSFTGSVEIVNCAGRVLVDNVHEGPSATFGPNITNSGRVWFSDCTFLRGVSATGSDVSLYDCTVRGASSLSGSPGLIVGGGSAVLSRCDVQGGDGIGVPAPAIELFGSSLVVTGDGSGGIRAGTGGAPAYAISGGFSSRVVRDDDVVLTPSGGAEQLSPLITNRVTTNIPSLRATGAPIGGEFTVDLYSEMGHFYYLFTGMPGNPTPLAGQEIPLLLALPGAVTYEVGVLTNSPRVQRGFIIPNIPLFVGVPFAWQAATGTTDRPNLSNADGYVFWM